MLSISILNGKPSYNLDILIFRHGTFSKKRKKDAATSSYLYIFHIEICHYAFTKKETCDLNGRRFHLLEIEKQKIFSIFTLCVQPKFCPSFPFCHFSGVLNCRRPPSIRISERNRRGRELGQGAPEVLM